MASSGRGSVSGSPAPQPCTSLAMDTKTVVGINTVLRIVPLCLQPTHPTHHPSQILSIRQDSRTALVVDTQGKSFYTRIPPRDARARREDISISEQIKLVGKLVYYNGLINLKFLQSSPPALPKQGPVSTPPVYRLHLR